MTGWTPLDHSLAQSLVARGVLSREALSAVWARGPQGAAWQGSQLAADLVRQGLVPKAALDGALNTLCGSAHGQETVVGSRSPSSGGGVVVPLAVERAFAGERYEPLGAVDAQGVLPALDRRLRRKVSMHMGPASQDPSAATFLREARILAQLDHPAIPKVHDLGALGGRSYYTLDLLEGGALTEQQDALLPGRLRAFLAIAAGVEHAHGRGLIHGALRPESVVLGRFGQTWITDWDQASAFAEASEEAKRATATASSIRIEKALLAPELRKGRAPSLATDVWGLGSILHWILLGQHPGRRAPDAGASREMLAILKKALATVSRDRYASVAALGEDVRRYLDHRRVEAAGESLFQTCRRLARRYPVPAAGAGVVALAFVVVAGLALQLGQAEYARLQTYEQKATQEQAAQAAQKAVEEGEREKAQQAAHRAEVEQEFERRLLAAISSVPEDEDERRAPRLFERAKALVEDSPLLALRLSRARGWWFMDHGRPDMAFADFQRALERDAQDEDAALGSYLAAKRLPGETHRQAERVALERLEDCGPKAAALVRATRLVQDISAAAERAEDVSSQADAALALLDSLGYEPVDHLRVVGHVEELRGLAHNCKIGLYTVASELYKSWRIKKEDKHHIWRGNVALDRAMQIDPAAVEPRLVRLRQHGIRWAYQATWRWLSCVQLRHLERVFALSRRPESLLVIAERLQVDRRAAESLVFLELFFEKPAHELPIGDVLARARVLRARALLYAGKTPDPADLADVPPELELDRQVLGAWISMRRGRIKAGLQALRRVPKPRHFYEVWRHREITDVLIDEYIDPQGMAQALAGTRRGWDERRRPSVLELAAMLANARLGRLQEKELNYVGKLQERGSLDFGEARLLLAWARGQGRADSRAHASALMLWASLNQRHHTNAREVRGARSLILERLRAMGREAAAQAFAEIDAIDALWPPRANVPPLVRITAKSAQ